MAPRVSRHSLSDVPPPSERVTLLARRIRNHGRFLRGAGRAALRGVGGVVFAGAVVGGALLHLDLGPARRIAQAAANAALQTPLKGRIEVGAIERLDPLGATVASARVLDADGRVVVEAWGIEGRLATWDLVRSLVAAGRPTEILVPEARIERARVHLVDDGTGFPTLFAAFEERSPTPSDPTSSGVRLRMPEAQIGRLDVEGDLGVPIDGTATRVRARVFVNDRIAVVRVQDAPVELRSIVPGGLRGAVSYHLRAWVGDGEPPPGDPAIATSADFSGAASGVGAVARWEMTDERMRARVDLPKVMPRQLHAFAPDVPLLAPASATVTLDGPLEHMQMDARLEIETSDGEGPPTVVMAEGVLAIDDVVHGAGPTGAEPPDELLLEASFHARDVDLAAIVATAPASRIGGRGRVALRAGEAGAVLVADVETDPTVIGGHAVPAVDAHVTVAGDELRISAHAHEPGAPIDLAVRVLPDGSLRFGADAAIASLGAVPRLGGAVGGAARGEVRGAMANGVLDARFSVAATGVRGPGGRVGAATARGTISGPPPDVTVAAQVTATDVAVDVDGGERTALDSATLRIDGPVLRPRLVIEGRDASGGVVAARAQADVAARALTGVGFSVARGDDRVEGRLDRIALVPGGVDVRGVTLSGDGVGALAGSLRVARGELSGSLRGENVDLARAARLAGFRVPIAGLVNLDVAVAPVGSGRRGHVELEIERGEVSVVHGISARLSARFDGEHVDASGYLRLVDEATIAERSAVAASGPDAPVLCDGAIAEVRLAGVDAEIAGPLLEPSTWRRATGTVDVSAERWNLHCLARRFPFVVPLSDARGTVTTRARFRRAEDAPYPAIESLYVRTRDLELVGPKPLLGEPAWSTRDLDVEVIGGASGETGRAELRIKIFDETYLATSEAFVELAGLYDAQEGALGAAIEQAEFGITVDVPRRGFDELQTLPTPLRGSVPDLLGEFRLRAAARGSLRDPTVSVELTAFGVQPPGAAASFAPPIDGQASVVYEAATGNAVLSATAQLENATVAHVVAGVEVPYAALRAGTRPLPWRGGVTATLNELPMGSFPILADRGVQGAVSGRATVTGLNEVPTVDIELELPFVQLGDAFFDGRVRATVRPASPTDAALLGGGAIDAATAAPDLADATLEVELTDHDQGSLELLGHARVAWTDGLLPVIDDTRRGGISMSADQLRLAAVQPAVAGVLSKVDGYLDGVLVFEWGDAAGTGKITSARLALTEGVVYVPDIGQELRGVQARIASDGPGDFVVEDVVAEGLSGRLTASGRVVVDGLTLDRAAAVVVIDEDERLPLTLEGVPLGRAWGRLEMELVNHPEANTITMQVAVPEFELAMPSAGARSVQSLEDHPDVVVGVPLGPPEEDARAADATAWEIGVDVAQLRVLVGDLARIEVRTGGEGAEPLVITITDDLATDGDLVVTGGMLDFLGKEFTFDAGIVRLDPEDPENPFVNVTAHWEGPDGGRIFLDYVGDLMPITDEKIRLRSDPARSEREILATLLFGDSLSDIPPGGSSAGGGGRAEGDGNVANTVGASVASTGLNSILKSAALSRISAELGTTDQGNFRSGIEVELTDDFTVGAASESIDASVQRTRTGGLQQRGAETLREVSAEWRFWRNWSLRGTAGYRESQARGSQLLGIDVLWQYRY